MHTAIKRVTIALVLAATLVLAACVPSPLPKDGPLVIATNSLIADVAAQVGGDLLEIAVLVPSGSDPHTYEPSAQDIAAVADADLILSNGLGLEGYLDSLLENAGGDASIVVVSTGVDLLELSEEHEHEEEIHEDDEHEEGEAGEHDEGEEHEHGSEDPHVWMNPQNVKVWADNIAVAFAELDPANAASYQANAAAYRAQLDELDDWAEQELSRIAAEDRELVTDHEVFGYFAERYDFELIGAVIPSTSTLSESSAAGIAALQTLVDEHEVRAIFVGFTINEAVAQRIAEDTGVQLVPLYSESLGQPGGPAATYIEMFRYNVNAIVSALTVE